MRRGRACESSVAALDVLVRGGAFEVEDRVEGVVAVWVACIVWLWTVLGAVKERVRALPCVVLRVVFERGGAEVGAERGHGGRWGRRRRRSSEVRLWSGRVVGRGQRRSRERGPGAREGQQPGEEVVASPHSTRRRATGERSPSQPSIAYIGWAALGCDYGHSGTSLSLP